jgi:hypothetical protein
VVKRVDKRETSASGSSVATAMPWTRVQPGARRSMRRGVLLADVLVATVIVGSAIAVLMSMTGRALRAQAQGEDLRVAAMLIDEKLNLVLARGADDYASRFRDLEGACEEPFQKFRYKVEISGSGSGGDAFTVVVSVSWMDGATPRTESVETRIAPRIGEDPDPDRRPETTVERL